MFRADFRTGESSKGQQIHDQSISIRHEQTVILINIDLVRKMASFRKPRSGADCMCMKFLFVFVIGGNMGRAELERQRNNDFDPHGPCSQDGPLRRCR